MRNVASKSYKMMLFGAYKPWIERNKAYIVHALKVEKSAQGLREP